MEVYKSLLKEVFWFNKFIRFQEQYSDDKFNMFSICGVNQFENTHSSILAEILNPEGSHKLNTLFLESFLETLKEGRPII